MVNYPVNLLFIYSYGVPEASLCQKICVGAVKALRDERLRQGLSMERLAAKAGLSKGMVSLVERELRNPTLDTFLRISGALKLDASVVLKKAASIAGKPSKTVPEKGA